MQGSGPLTTRPKYGCTSWRSRHGRCPTRPPWVSAAATDWHAQATVGFVGCVSSCLDEHLHTDPARVAVAIDLSGRALQRLTEWSPAIPKKVVNSFGTGGEEESFTTDLAVGPLLACGRAFISLLRGELPPGYDRWAR
jgi:hypothetical protein